MTSFSVRIAFVFFHVLGLGLLFQPAGAEKTITENDLKDKARGMWLGQLIGNMAGRPTEGHYQTTPNPAPNVPWIIKQEWDGEDDTDIEYVALHILEANGFACTSRQIADQWLRHMTQSGIYIANRQALSLMEDGFLPPQTGSRTYNEHWYAIDSQITTETLGAVSPGLVQQAIDLAGKFSHISNQGFPVHAAQFYVAMYAHAFFEPDVVALVNQGLTAIPQTSRTHRVVSDVLNWYQADALDGPLDWRATRQKLYDHYQGVNSYGRYYYWIESTVNVGATALAILYGQGDFKETVQIGVLAGWDCDCNPAHAGGLIGIINGYSGLPADLTDPNICGDVYKNVYRPYLPDPNAYRPQYESITSITSRIAGLAEQNILAQGGTITYDPEKTYHIPDSTGVMTEPPLPDPNGPAGLVAQAWDAGLAVTTSAAVEYHNPNSDRRNLDAIIDGITNNSHNGHKAYYSYLSDPGQRPQPDWYQINFSQPVKFQGLTFYEGDIVWQGINTYYKNDNARGGFFNDLTVEILRDNRYITPANLQMAPLLDRWQMYQDISFTFAPTVGDAIRIIGSPGGTQGYTTIMELEVNGNVDPGLYVASVEIADNQIQRSHVARMVVEFNRKVNITGQDIALGGTVNGTVLSTDDIDFVYDNISNRLTLEFDTNSDGFFGDSLPDDLYRLTLDCNAITDLGGLTLLDDDDNPADGVYTITFHRLFGDTDGSGKIELVDLENFASVWLGPPLDTGLDDNTDGKITLFELATFAQNWLMDFL